MISITTLVKQMYDSSNAELAKKMSAYMKNLFPFLGIQANTRRMLQKEFIQSKTKESVIDWECVSYFFNLPEREFHYIAIDCLVKAKKKIQKEEIFQLERYISWNSWWDSIDILAGVIGNVVLQYPELEECFIEPCIVHDTMWFRRISIIYQLQYKVQTNTAMLEKAILSNTGTKEFFINKAIGWALREYAKTNAQWVCDFIQQYNNILHTLSIREATKHIV